MSYLEETLRDIVVSPLRDIEQVVLDGWDTAGHDPWDILQRVLDMVGNVSRDTESLSRDTGLSLSRVPDELSRDTAGHRPGHVPPQVSGLSRVPGVSRDVPLSRTPRVPADPGQRDMARDMVSRGVPKDKVAAELGVHVRTVNRWIKSDKETTT